MDAKDQARVTQGLNVCVSSIDCMVSRHVHCNTSDTNNDRNNEPLKSVSMFRKANTGKCHLFEVLCLIYLKDARPF